MKKFSVLLAIVVVFGCGGFSGCDNYPEYSQAAGSGKNGRSLTIATWNVQALFDGEDSGTEYAEYAAAKGWNEERYQARLAAIAKAVDSLDGGVIPDILVLVEVENAKVLEDLVTKHLDKAGYHWTFFAGNKGYSLGTGILSKYPFTKTQVHSVMKDGNMLPRPITEAWFTPDASAQDREAGGIPENPAENSIVLFVCHWKSKLGGDALTEGQRRNAARAILRRKREISAQYGNVPMVVLGDLNENHDEFTRQKSSIVCALLPDTKTAARVAAEDALANSAAFKSGESEDSEETVSFDNPASQADFLILSAEKPPVSRNFPGADGVFYTPWGTELEPGSYWYSGWETIDHFLLTTGFFDNTGWDFKTCHRCDVEPFINSKGEPASYNPRTGNGLSDHLPLVMEIVRN